MSGKCLDPSSPRPVSEIERLIEKAHEGLTVWEEAAESLIEQQNKGTPDDAKWFEQVAGALEDAAEAVSDLTKLDTDDIKKPDNFLEYAKENNALGGSLAGDSKVISFYNDYVEAFGGPADLDKLPQSRRQQRAAGQGLSPAKFNQKYGSKIGCPNGDLEEYIKEKVLNDSAAAIATILEIDKSRVLETTLTAADIAAAADSTEGLNAALARSKAVEDQGQRDIDEIKENLLATKAIYQEQCFLLSQLSKLIKFKKKRGRARLPYVEAKTPHRTREGQQIKSINQNAPLMINDEPFGFMNRLTQAPHSRQLLNLTTDKLSILVPTVRLYKVQTDKGSGKDVGFVEIKFDTNPAIKSYAGGKSALDLFKNSKKRGVGVGLKDFNFTFHGSDPFAAKKAIQAKLRIFATSFGDLIQDRKGDYTALADEFKKTAPLANYKFADLALKTGRMPDDLKRNMSEIQKENLDKLNFRLKVVLGWSIPDNYTSNFTLQEKNAIYDSFININLTPTTHEFNFDETGGVSFDINYLAYIEDYFNNSGFNIFGSKGIEKNRAARKVFYEFLNNNNCNSTNTEELKKEDAKFIQQEKTQSMSNIITTLNLQKKMLFYNLSYKQISSYLKTGRVPPDGLPNPTLDNSLAVTKIMKAYKSQLNSISGVEEATLDGIKIALASVSRETNKISFFFISDLIDIIMQNIDKGLESLNEALEQKSGSALNYYNIANDQGFQLPASDKKTYEDYLKSSPLVAKEIEKFKTMKEQFRKLRIILGPMEVVDPLNNGEIIFCNIGDMPISLNYFMDFLSQKVLSKDYAYYPITNFIKDLTNDLIRNFLNNDSCFSFNTKQKIRLNSSVVTGFNHSSLPKKYSDNITWFIDSNNSHIVKSGRNKGKKALYPFGIGNILNLGSPAARKIKPIISVSGKSRDPISLLQPNKEINYYIFYAGRSYPTEKMTGNELEDSRNGIFHYTLGKDRGIIKNISLDKTDMTGLKELRFETEGFDGLTQLREVYNANIDCLLNTHTFPGSYIYVEPKGFSPEAGIDYTQFGIGGYYMITRSEHSIGVGKADTKITAKWVADAKGNNSENQKKEQTPAEQQKPSKCSVNLRKTKLDESNNLLMMDDATLDFWAKAAYDNGWFIGD